MNVFPITKNKSFSGWIDPTKYRQQIIESAEKTKVPTSKLKEILASFDWLENKTPNYDIKYKNEKNCLSLTLNNKTEQQKSGIITFLNDKTDDFGEKLNFLLDYTIQKLNQ